MTEMIKYLMDNYYAHYKGLRDDVIPTSDQLEQALSNHPDKLVVVRDELGIKGMAVFLRLSDKSYNHLQKMDISQLDVIKALLPEDGDNFHFVLLAAGDFKTIMSGLRKVIKSQKPRTISWWDPEYTKLHRYNLK